MERHFLTTHVATLKHYQHFQKEKYRAQAKIQGLNTHKEHTCDKEYQALEAAMCILSKMENTNFLGCLFCVEHEVLEELAFKPLNADHFLRTALTFIGTITQSSLDVTSRQLVSCAVIP